MPSLLPLACWLQYIHDVLQEAGNGHIDIEGVEQALEYVEDLRKPHLKFGWIKAKFVRVKDRFYNRNSEAMVEDN